MRAFLSSTYEDLKEHRKEAIHTLDCLGIDVSCMERWPGGPHSPTAASLNHVEECDIFVGIYAHSYGFIPTDADISIVEEEYRFARELGKPCFCFLVSKDFHWLPEYMDGEPGRSKLADLKARLRETVTSCEFTTPDSLGKELAMAIPQHRSSHREPAAIGRMQPARSELIMPEEMREARSLPPSVLTGRILSLPDVGHRPVSPYETTLEEFRNWWGWGYCGEAEGLKIEDMRIQQAKNLDGTYFHESEEFAELIEMLRSRRHNVLVCGKPKAGKTRMALEAMRKLTGTWVLCLEPLAKNDNPELLQSPELPRLPESIPSAVLFYDDLERYHELQEPERLVRALGARRVIVLATLRENPEYERAQRIFGQAMSILTPVRIRPINMESAETVASQAEVMSDWKGAFDGTIGSVLLDVGYKSYIFREWRDGSVERAVLSVCKLLRLCGVYSYQMPEVVEISREVLDVSVAPTESHNWLRNLDGCRRSGLFRHAGASR